MSGIADAFQYSFPPDGSAHPDHLVDLLWNWVDYNFCQALPGAVAFVISQDAAITVFCHTQQEQRSGATDSDVEMFEGLTPERWLM